MTDKREFIISIALQRNLLFEKKRKLENYRRLNKYAKKGGILFTGSSLMEQFPVCEFCSDWNSSLTVYNRGIGGLTSEEFINDMDTLLLDTEPSSVFINIGTNDLNGDESLQKQLDLLCENYRIILNACRENLPDASVSIMAFYPMNEDLPGAPPDFRKKFSSRTNEKIREANLRLKALATSYGYTFLDFNDELTDAGGQLRREYTVDGIHMYADAYRRIFDRLKEYM